MKLKFKYLSGFIFLMLLLGFSFQNCSPNNFTTQTSPSLVSKLNSDNSFDSFPVDDGYILVGDMLLEHSKLSHSRLKKFGPSSKEKQIATSFSYYGRSPWPNGKVYIDAVTNNIPNETINLIKKACEMWIGESNVECIFVDGNSGFNAVTVRHGANRNICSASVGYSGTSGANRLTLGANCALYEILHEMGHIFGFMHEHQRQNQEEYITLTGPHDRDSDIFKLNWGIIETSDASNSSKDYDVNSIMHYDRIQMFNDGKLYPAFEVKKGPKQSFAIINGKLGRTTMLTDLDKKGLVSLYGKKEDAQAARDAQATQTPKPAISSSNKPKVPFRIVDCSTHNGKVVTKIDQKVYGIGKGAKACFNLQSRISTNCTKESDLDTMIHAWGEASYDKTKDVWTKVVNVTDNGWPAEGGKYFYVIRTEDGQKITENLQMSLNSAQHKPECRDDDGYHPW